MPIIAAVITAVATIAAAVIAAVAVAGDDSHPGTPAAAGTSASAPVSPAGAGPSAKPSDPPLQTLPAGDPAASPTLVSGPRLIATPDMAAAKARVTLEGSGYTPGERVRITFRFTGGGYEADLRNVTVGPDGRFAAEVKVPVDRPTGMETPVFRAHGLDNVDTDNQADTPFTYTE
ncbi:hypothetical protein ACWEF9_08335 [Streptomyces sp. NPDC004980]